MISYNEAYHLTLDHILSLPAETVSLSAALERAPVNNLLARVDSPSLDVSFKDGFAVQSADISQATARTYVLLRLVGSVAAGGTWDGEVSAAQRRFLGGRSGRLQSRTKSLNSAHIRTTGWVAARSQANVAAALGLVDSMLYLVISNCSNH